MQSRREIETDWKGSSAFKIVPPFLYDFLGYVFPVGYFILRLAFIAKW